ncbi:NGFI-A-binding protein 2 isoform X2 [Rhineura floridana]|uniref:NGFI-A-binding protein 2 isoform X2 n=1 Tax=Rhineura floridana TaxID=261503 RepID=UPI002AC825DD|nr:NGFI-A-binding protein 2 isoform X2 [Rhineura floridana]
MGGDGGVKLCALAPLHACMDRTEGERRERGRYFSFRLWRLPLQFFWSEARAACRPRNLPRAAAARSRRRCSIVNPAAWEAIPCQRLSAEARRERRGGKGGQGNGDAPRDGSRKPSGWTGSVRRPAIPLVRALLARKAPSPPPPARRRRPWVHAPRSRPPGSEGIQQRREIAARTEPQAMALSLPRTLGELQLYRVLQRANLLSYYETFIQQGGDDVQQLCEAGEEEFLEIMALVGMATKPLHVRRLQKALREWATNPGVFNQPVPSIPVSSIPLFKISESGGRKSLTNGHISPGEVLGKAIGTSPAKSPSDPREKLSPLPAIQWGNPESEEEGGASSPSEQPPSTEHLDPELVQAVSDSVDRLLRTCPRGGGDTELRTLMKLNKKLAKTVGHIFRMDNGDPRKEEEVRRHSAIYGRGEARRCEGKQLTLHELTINEAAAQFCLRDNSLLLQRVELFSLSRQVARESSYLSSLKGSRLHPDETGAGQAKRFKREVAEHPRPELPLVCEPFLPQYRSSVEEDTASLSGESLDGHPQATGSCPRLTPPPNAAPDSLLSLPPHGLWSRHILQQTLMDEGLRLARLVSHERVGRLSPCLPGKPQGPEFGENLSERCQPPPAQPETRRNSIKVEPETSRQ